jgi:hypothetical protein
MIKQYDAVDYVVHKTPLNIEQGYPPLLEVLPELSLCVQQSSLQLDLLLLTGELNPTPTSSVSSCSPCYQRPNGRTLISCGKV